MSNTNGASTSGTSNGGAATTGTGTDASVATNDAGTSDGGQGRAEGGAAPVEGGTPLDAATEPGAMADCTPIEWANPNGIPVPDVAPVEGDQDGFFGQKSGLDEFDYTAQEFFFTGSSPAYKSRMVVRRPSDPAKFSGTVFVEWYNVSGGIDFAVLWASSREYFMREGHAFVTVSAQAGGVNALRNDYPERYGSLEHPGDSAANAVFSQAAAAIRSHSETLFGPCMPTKALLAVGQSQSSMRLADYVNNTHPSDQVYDGYMLHSGREPASNDPGVPVFVVLTMNEGNGSLSDGPNMVKWVVAGATHNDKRITERGAEIADSIDVAVSECTNPMNNFPSYRVYNAALDGLHRWIREGEKPPAGMPFQESGSGLATDDFGNVLGGVRSQDIEVPIATHGLDNGPADLLDIIGYLACGLGGSQVPFSEETLLELYPTHEDYVQRYTAAADAALAAGFVLQADRDLAVQQAEAAPIPK